MSYEEDILRNPYSFKTWWYYLDLKAEAAPEVYLNHLLFYVGYCFIPCPYAHI